MNSDVIQHLYLIVFSSVLTTCLLFIAYIVGYFKNQQTPPVFVSVQDTLKIFSLFILLQFFIFPLLASLGLILANRLGYTLPEFQDWANLIAIGLMGLAILLFCWSRQHQMRHLFRTSHLFQDVALGISSWLIAYPPVLLVSQLSILILSGFWGYSLVDQLAVKQVKQVVGHPVLLAFTLIAVLGIVPVLEEVLFRGFLQSTLRHFFSKCYAIVLSSFIFAVFHFALSQGAYNATVISSLFVLALFLGFLKERQGSLWPCIALHITFNAISVAMIIVQATFEI